MIGYYNGELIESIHNLSKEVRELWENLHFLDTTDYEYIISYYNHPYHTEILNEEQKKNIKLFKGKTLELANILFEK